MNTGKELAMRSEEYIQSKDGAILFPPTLQEIAKDWLETKSSRTGSEKTRRAYQDTLDKFHIYLQEQGCTLNSDARLVGRHAQKWASLPQEKEKVSSSTENQRLAILSSFYKFAIKHGLCEYNPISYVERPKRNIKHAALPMSAKDITDNMKAIDTSKLEGKRDKALLSLALVTGRRANELIDLVWDDIKITGSKVTITWKRCKGDKMIIDELSNRTVDVLLEYLREIYGQKLEKIRPQSPLFVSFSNNNRGGKLSMQAISDICKERLGVSQFYVTRHSFTISMEAAGASLSEIGERLGHSNYKVTAHYLKQLHSSENKYAGTLEERFGI